MACMFCSRKYELSDGVCPYLFLVPLFTTFLEKNTYKPININKIGRTFALNLI